MIKKNFSYLVILILVIILGGLLWLKKNQLVKPNTSSVQEQGQTQQANPSNNSASASESPAVSDQDIDNKLKALDDDAKEINQGLNDQPLDVLEEK